MRNKVKMNKKKKDSTNVTYEFTRSTTFFLTKFTSENLLPVGKLTTNKFKKRELKSLKFEGMEQMSSFSSDNGKPKRAILTMQLNALLVVDKVEAD